MKIIKQTHVFHELEEVDEGAGTKLKRFIHKTLDIVPMPSHVRENIKQCGGCKAREQALNQVEIKIKDLFK